jgi:GTPase SAR1 family protein
MEKLAILNLNQTKTSKSPLIKYDHLPQPPFRLVCVGSSNSGKSNMIKNLLTRDEFGYNKFFGENVVVFSKTLGLDSTWSSLGLPKTHMYREWDDEVVRQIMAYSKKQKNGLLLLLDDLISDPKAFNKKNANLLTELFYTGRHHRISLCITSQRLHAVPSGMLGNCSQMCVFRLKTRRERESFLEVVNNFEDLEQKYEYAVREPFAFVYLNLQTGRVYRNFVQEL